MVQKNNFMKSAGRRGDSPLARVLTAIVMMLTLATTGAWADETYPIVYDFEAVANAGENPANKNGSSANGQQFYGWESAEKTDWPRQDYKGYEYAEGSKLPEVCHVWRRSDRINGNVAGNGGLKCPSNKEMAIDGLTAGLTVTIIYDATNATSKEIVWAIGDGSSSQLTQPRATATINGVEAVPGQTTIKSGDVITVNSVTEAQNGSGYIVFKVMKDMVIKKVIIDEAKAEPATYTVTLKEGTVDAEKWTATPNPATAGQTVTVTYTGSKKVIGVKAEKKAAAEPTAANATASDIGKVVCADGHLHDAKTAVPDGCTAVGILGKVTETGHGLILALQDATAQTWNTINGWTSETTYAGTTLKVLSNDAARGSLTSYTTLGETTVSNWAVAQKGDYDAIFTNLGSTTGDSDGKVYDANVNAYITTGVGGTAISGNYWSATEDSDGDAWDFSSNYWDRSDGMTSRSVRPVLGF